MKRIFKLTIAFLLVLTTLFYTVSCGGNKPITPDEDGYVSYTDLGLNFRLPQDMDQKNVQYAAICFTNREATFLANVFETTTVRENWYLRDGFTVSEYTERFIVENNYKCDFEYDEETNVATFGVHYPIYETSDEEPEYYYHYITIAGSSVYIIVMSCKEEFFEKYEEEFLKWQTFISIG